MRTELISIPTATTPLDGALHWPDGPVTGAVLLFHGNTMNFYVGAPRFLPPAAGAKFRLPNPPTKPAKRPIPLLPILLLPIGSAIVTIIATGKWTFVFIALLSPIAALVSQFSGRKQAMTSLRMQQASHQLKQR